MTVQRIARIYQRVSTTQQDLQRQQRLIKDAEEAGFYIAAVYAEKASGTTENRPELQRMISDLKQGDVIIAEHLDRLTRLPLAKAESLMARIKSTGAKVSVPGIIELPRPGDELGDALVASMQEMLLKIALYQCRQDYETRRNRQAEGISLAKAKGVYKGRKPDVVANAKIVELRKIGYTIAKIADTLNLSQSQVKLKLRLIVEQ